LAKNWLVWLPVGMSRRRSLREQVVAVKVVQEFQQVLQVALDAFAQHKAVVARELAR
jgi:hypothetical protein